MGESSDTNLRVTAIHVGMRNETPSNLLFGLPEHFIDLLEVDMSRFTEDFRPAKRPREVGDDVLNHGIRRNEFGRRGTAIRRIPQEHTFSSDF